MGFTEAQTFSSQNLILGNAAQFYCGYLNFWETILPFFFCLSCLISHFLFRSSSFLAFFGLMGKKKIIADDLLALCLYLFMFFFSGFFGDYNTRKFLVYLESVFYHFL